MNVLPGMNGNEVQAMNLMIRWLVTALVAAGTMACGGKSGSSSTSSGGSTSAPAPTTSSTRCGGPTNIACTGDRQICIYEQSENCGIFGETGQCVTRPTPTSCSTLVNEVCGCNGKTYLNACNAAYHGVSVESQGRCPGDTVGPLDCRNDLTWPEDWKTREKAIFEAINDLRAQGASCRGVEYSPLPPLIVSAELRQAARCHSLDMAVQGYFAHGYPGSGMFGDRAAAAGYPGIARGEIIAGGYATIGGAVNGWMGSTSGHCEMIMGVGTSARLSTEIGIGYVHFPNSPKRHYDTGVFGSRN
jgi:uncharacterized protein YkwD